MACLWTLHCNGPVMISLESCGAVAVSGCMTSSAGGAFSAETASMDHHPASGQVVANRVGETPS